MKKYILLLILSLILLTSCVNNKQEEVTVIAPSGTPSLALSHYFSTHDFLTKYEIVAGSDPLVSSFNNKTHDIIVAPVNLGAKLYKVNGNYVHYKTFVWTVYDLAVNIPKEYNRSAAQRPISWC